MPYTLTPAERRARAQAVMRQRENRYALTNYITSQKRAAAERAEQINQAKIEAETEKNRQGFFTRAFHTIGDLAANVLTGAVKGLEGIYDFGAGIVGGIGGLFDKDFQNSVKKSIAYDWTGETIGKPLQEATKYSYLTDGGLVEQVASGVGQMLPAVAVSVATGGLGAPAAIAQGSSLATLGLSAAGNSTEEAFQDGADYGAGLLYGAASGAVEVATEKMWGGFGKLTGGGFLDNVGKSVASTGIRRVAKEAVQEGIEEVVSEVANPALKAIYKGGSALEEYKDPEYWKRVGEAGLVGGLTSVVYGGSVGKVIDTVKGTNQDIGDSLDEVENLRKKRNNLFVNDRLTAENEARIDENLRANYANIERVLKKSSENTRAKYIKTYNLSEAFEADGTMKSDFAVHLGITPAAAQTDTEGGEAAHTPLASLDKRYYHPSLRGQEQRIAESLARQGTRVFSGELTETEQANYTKFKKAFNALAQKGLVEPDFVVAETTDKFYSYIDGKTVVLGKDVFESDAWQKKLIHETTHFTEGTKEWVDYANFILSQTDTSDAITSILQKGYGITQADVDTLQDAIQRGELTDNHRLLLSEIMATQSENLFGNEAMIAKLTQERRSLARRIFDKIKNFIKVLKAKSPEEKTVIKKLETAQKLFEKALGRAGTEYAAKRRAESVSEERSSEETERGEQPSEDSRDETETRKKKRRKKRKSYSLKPVKPVEATSGEWSATIDTDEAMRRFPNLWNVAAEQSETRNPTQIRGTVTTYRKIYDYLKKEGFKGTILDASSGLGYGTRAGIEEYGFNVEDIEPFPDSDYSPKYTDYSTLNKKYDVIISNAVLNVLPQDQRDALVAKMGEMLNVGGRLFINVRGDDVNTLSSNPKNVRIGDMEWYVDSTGSYQKGFTRSELIAYLKDALGENFTVSPATFFGKTSVIVTKNAESGVRYSLKLGDETVSGTMDEGDSLVALHNLSEDNLMRVLKLGGFPMPSIAVTRSDMAHDDFGDITVIFGRDTIDPAASRENKVYSKDGWTPAVPPIEYKANERVQKRIHDKYSAIAKKVGYDAAQPLYKYVVDIERVLARSGGEVGMLSEIYQDTDIMNLFLVDTGRERVEQIKREIRTEMSDGEKQFNSQLVNLLGEEFIERYEALNGDREGRKAFIRENKEKIVDALATIMKGDESLDAARQEISENISIFGLGTRLNHAIHYLHEDGVSVREEIDSSATQDAIRRATPQKEYKEWVDSIFGGIQEKVGIRNNTDPFTRSGNRRSFEATHYDYTLENIVEAMKGDDEHGAGWVHGLTLGQLSAKLAKEFKSIDEIRQDSDSLKKSDEAMHEEFSETSRKMLEEITGEMVDRSRFSDEVDYWTSLDSASVVIGEIAEMGCRTLSEIASYMNREYKTAYRYNDSIGRKILGLFEYVQKMTDTDYFEAKPRRAVGLDEIRRVLLPESASEELRSELQKHNVPFEVYKDGESRADIISRMDDVKFSRKDSEGRALTEGQAEYFRDSQVRDEEGNLLVVYHGTHGGDFTVFEHGKAPKNDAGWLGEGFYFYGDEHEAQIYAMNGGRVIEAYLDVKNPYYATAEDMERLAEMDDETESRKFSDGLIADGYDGVYFNGDLRQEWVVFNANQIKLVSNENPSTDPDIRYARKGGDYFYELTDGQIKKMLADHTKFKVYSKVEAEQVINDILSNYMTFGDKYGVLRGKAKSEVIEMLWRGLNTADSGRQMKVALDIAEYIIQNSAVESLWGDEDMQAYVDIIDALKPYLHSLDLNGIKGEIRYRYDKDNSAYLLWGKPRSEKGIGPDQLALILENSGIHIDAINEADIFFEIDSAYRNAVQALKKKAKEMLTDALSSSDRRQMKQDIAREVLRSFDTKGKPSKLAAIVEKYRKQALVWKEKYLEERSKNRLLNRILDKTQKLKDIKLGTFLNASQFKSDVFKGSIEKLANIKYRGNLSDAATRKILGGLREWYVETNPLLEGVYDNDIAALLEIISSREGKLSVDELRALENVVDHFKHIIETYNKVYRNGAYVEAQPIAEGYIKTLRANKGVQVGWFARLTEKIFNNSRASYLQTFADPMTVARRMDMYEDGFYTEMLSTLREGAVNAGIEEMEMRAPIEDFLKTHKKYLKELGKRTMGYGGQTIPAAQAISIYMTLNREQALRGLMESGFTYETEDGQVRLNGIAPGEELTIEEMKVRAKEVQDELFKQFTEADKEYITIADHIFNEVAKEAKRRTDIARRGYSNALDSYYFPIRRAFIAHSVDTSTFIDEMNRVSNASFNKDTVQGAKNELYIEPIDRVLDRHIHAVAQYANLALAIDEYNKIYNLDIGDNPNKPTSVKTESVDVWKRGDEYFKKLISDIQGIPTSKGAGRKIMGYIRGSYAKFQLGANPKVWVTQLSSLAAAGSILDVSSITRGIGMRVSDAEVDQYCPLAKLRNNENTVAMAQGIIEKVDRVSGVLMTPIGKVDRFVVKRLFGACQVQVEKNGGAKVGTEENKVKAGELLKKVILETQQNTFSASRSAAMRSDSELMKTVTMFSSDAMKVVGRVIDSIGEVAVLRAKLKAETDAGVREKLSARLKTANRKARKSVASLVASAAFMALIAQVFRWLYKKDDEDESVAETMTVDFIGNLFGGLPLIKDIYARFMEGYDLDNYAYSAINELFDSAENVFNLIGDMASGNMDSKDIAGVLKSLFFSAGQMFGIPTRNMYNVVNGLTKRISPTSAYKVDSMLYDQNYRADLNSAIERGDDVMVATIVGIMLDENIGEVTNSNARKELDRLVKAGYNVIPRSVGKTIVYDGEETALSTRQVGEFKQVYSVANKALASLVGLSQYQEADDDVKAKAVNFIYNTYYNLAVEDFVGVELESKNTLFAEAIDIEKLAIIIAMARSIVADTDKRGNAISGSRKAKIQAYINSLRLTAAQKYMIMGYLGYTNTKGEAQVNAYINRLSLSKNEKAKLLQYSGYAA